MAFLYYLMPASASAQQNTRTITGRITTEQGEPLEGVSVQVKGTRLASGSQADGIYYIPVSVGDSTLVFRHPGYQQQEVKITHEEEYNIQLRAQPNFSSPSCP